MNQKIWFHVLFAQKPVSLMAEKTEINVIEKQLGRYIFRWPGEI
jgi:hypothetical protein